MILFTCPSHLPKTNQPTPKKQNKTTLHSALKQSLTKLIFLQEDERVISFERGKQLADSLGLEFFETSAKENINVRVSYDVIKLLL